MIKSKRCLKFWNIPYLKLAGIHVLTLVSLKTLFYFYIERVIRRLREFTLLKPHACVNHSLVKVLDDVITIACGLINLQDSLIK